MPKNFEFMSCRTSEFSAAELRQGDILRRTEELSERLAEAHGYYATAPGYDYFMVLTPTCEMVLRDGRCSTRYLTIAAVRPLEILIDRQLGNYTKSMKAPGTFCRSDRRQVAEQFLMRILHNTEPGYFFLPGELFPGGEQPDRAAFLRLSVALRATHYDACANAKVLQLADSFSAKVGSLAANLYGQVATPAIEEQVDVNFKEIIGQFIEKSLDRPSIHWLSAPGLKHVNTAIKEAKQRLDVAELTLEQTQEVVKATPNDQALLANRIQSLLSTKGVEAAKVEELRNLIASDSIVAQFLKR
ncbi:hypothetical protein [Sphingobium sp.]|uniref:hypothetical protein n=1 Tax=Sphingobium sp. TaxID=1912891 RepID=UPI0028BDEB00|nr:hypothetical protein [Sphingobium sp.]